MVIVNLSHGQCVRGLSGLVKTEMIRLCERGIDLIAIFSCSMKTNIKLTVINLLYSADILDSIVTQ